MNASAPSRRLFLAAAGTAFSGFASSLAAAPSEEGRWQTIRGRFAFPEDKVPMNAANLCPSPTVVAERVAELTHDIDVDCSFQNREKFKQQLEDSRAAVAKHLGVSADEVALVRNTSESNNTINNGMSLKSGDEVVLWEQNHPTNNVAWEVRAKRFGLRVTKVKTPAKPNSIDDLIGPFEKALSDKTRVLALTHASNVSGVRLPARELAEIAHRRGIHVHLDGAQSWGALNVKLREIGCDSYSASGHKWFVGPKEVGLLYVRKERIPSIWPNIVAPGWGTGPETGLVGARKFESLGQRDDAALTAVGTTADFHGMVGLAAIEKRVFELASQLKAGLKDAGARLVTPEQAEFSAGVCIMEVPAENRQRVLDGLYRDHGIAGSTSGGLRLCPHFYNTSEHVNRAIKGVKAMRNLWA